MVYDPSFPLIVPVTLRPSDIEAVLPAMVYDQPLFDEVPEQPFWNKVSSGKFLPVEEYAPEMSMQADVEVVVAARVEVGIVVTFGAGVGEGIGTVVVAKVGAGVGKGVVT